VLSAIVGATAAAPARTPQRLLATACGFAVATPVLLWLVAATATPPWA
jgi:hypothetical protein